MFCLTFWQGKCIPYCTILSTSRLFLLVGQESFEVHRRNLCHHPLQELYFKYKTVYYFRFVLYAVYYRKVVVLCYFAETRTLLAETRNCQRNAKFRFHIFLHYHVIIGRMTRKPGIFQKEARIKYIKTMDSLKQFSLPYFYFI